MQTRKNFLVNTSLLATSIFTAKPLAALTKITEPINTVIQNENALLLLHYTTDNIKNVTENISKLKTTITNTLLINNDNKENGTSTNELLNEINSRHLDNYKIIKKGAIKVGVFTTNNNNLSTINEMAFHLKNEKKCNLVVCVSSLGFRNKSTIDDVQLASQSQNIDFIIGKNEKNYCPNPYITLNKNKTEVIINHSIDKILDLGSIALTFDDYGNKRTIDFLLN